jgi:riboflavin kinase/FMN adenylyltransferase
VFDGVHIGHRHVLTETVLYGQERRAPSVVVTFGTHPKGVISGTPPQLITSLRRRLGLFAALGLDAALVLEFDETLRATSAEAFAERVFADALDCRLVVLGCDTRFGRGGRGDLALLREVGARRGFEAVNADAVVVGGQKVSSTRIRDAILRGELGDAARMLGRPVSVLGTVVQGDGRGRTLGWPTANLDLHRRGAAPARRLGRRSDGGRNSAPRALQHRLPADVRRPAAGRPRRMGVP